jgi:hypothetical protein
MNSYVGKFFFELGVVEEIAGKIHLTKWFQISQSFLAALALGSGRIFAG